MPDPLVFATARELAEAVLRTAPNGADTFRIDAEAQRPAEEVARTSVASNTFRAFHHVNPPPSRLFREWAVGSMNGSLETDLSRITSQDEFDEWHSNWCDTFSGEWLERSGKSINWGASRKLPDLLFFFILQYWRTASFTNDRAVSLSWFANVPLDSFVLQTIRAHVLLKRTGLPRIPKSASMGWVPDEATYREIQTGIRELCTTVEVPGICLDFLAWGETHA